jgi:uncharacterized protein (TIGR03086 family)
VAALNRGLELLESAIGYALTSLADVRPARLDGPTPCREWTLELLLVHLGDSILVLRQAVADGRIDQVSRAANHRTPTAGVRAEAIALLETCAAVRTDESVVRVGDRELPGSLAAVTGAMEITVHGWDIGVASGLRRPIPPLLAGVLLALAPVILPPQIRPGLFDEPVVLPAEAGVSDRLVAFLGRHPQ